MRDNSGGGKSKNNNHDHTLKEHDGGPGERPRDKDFSVAADASEPGEHRSPSARGRGETAGGEPASPVDIDTAR